MKNKKLTAASVAFVTALTVTGCSDKPEILTNARDGKDMTSTEASQVKASLIDMGCEALSTRVFDKDLIDRSIYDTRSGAIQKLEDEYKLDCIEKLWEADRPETDHSEVETITPPSNE